MSEEEQQQQQHELQHEQQEEKLEEEPPEEPIFIPDANFSIAVHTIINHAQQSHGLLPHNDYTQYRKYLTKRLARIRHAKPVIKSLSHGPKSKREITTTTTTTTTTNNNTTTKKGGGKHAFQPRDEITIQKANTHINYILEYIYSTERSWAHSMELKSQYEHLISNSYQSQKKSSSLQTNKKSSSPGKVRQHYINQLKKAVKNVDMLKKIVIRGVVDELTCLEVDCYNAWMKGNYFCEVQKWEVRVFVCVFVCVCVCVSVCIYYVLCIMYYIHVWSNFVFALSLSLSLSSYFIYS